MDNSCAGLITPVKDDASVSIDLTIFQKTVVTDFLLSTSLEKFIPERLCCNFFVIHYITSHYYIHYRWAHTMSKRDSVLQRLMKWPNVARSQPLRRSEWNPGVVTRR